MVSDEVHRQRQRVTVGWALLLQLDDLALVGDGHLAFQIVERPDVRGFQACVVELLAVKRRVLIGVMGQRLHALQVQLVKLGARHGFSQPVPERASHRS